MSPAPHTPAIDERALAESLVRFADAPGPDTITDVPFASEVSLGLGDRLLVRRPAEELIDRDAWVVHAPAGFQGRSGPFSALDQLADADRTTVSVESYPSCANPSRDLAPPAELADLARVSIRPDPAAISTCILWWSVDLYLTASGEITGVTLDFWDP